MLAISRIKLEYRGPTDYFIIKFRVPFLKRMNRAGRPLVDRFSKKVIVINLVKVEHSYFTLYLLPGKYPPSISRFGDVVSRGKISGVYFREPVFAIYEGGLFKQDNVVN